MKMKFKRFLSGVMAVATLASVIVQPVAVSASELEPEEIPFEQQYPELTEVQDSLDPDEVVVANDIEIAYGDEFEVEVNLSGIDGVDESKMKILFHEAKNADGADFDTNTPDTYKAVYAVEPVSGHPSYRISRNITVKEPETETQSESSSEIAVDDDSGTGDTEQSDDDSESHQENTVDTETELTVSEVLEQAETNGIDLYAMDAGETVTFMASAGNARSSQQVSVTRGTMYRYADYGYGTYLTYQYTVKFGNVSATAYCVQPSKPGPGSGTYTINKVGDGKALAKVCYYGTKASGDDGFFTEENGYGNLSAGARFILVHLAASYANGSGDAFSGANSTAQNLAMKLYNYCVSQPEIPDVAMSFSDANVKAYVDGNSQRTKNITFNADALQTITMKLPAGVQLHNLTTGKTSKGGNQIFKPLSKSKPFSTPLFAYAEVFWSNVINEYFVSAPLYQLAFCHGYEEETQKYYDYGTVVPRIYNKDEQLLNLLEFFRKYPDKKVDIDQYENYCMMFYDYTDILEASYFQNHKDMAEQLAMQILVSVLKGDQNYHYENIAFVCNKKGEILRLAPMIDHEFSTYFMFPDNSAQHMYWYSELIRSMEGHEVQDYEYDCLKNPKERQMMEKSAVCLHKNLVYIKEHYPEVTGKFLEKLNCLKHDLEENPSPFYLQENIEYPGTANSYAYMSGKARYKDHDEEKAKLLEEKYSSREKKIDFHVLSVQSVQEIKGIIRLLKVMLEKENGNWDKVKEQNDEYKAETGFTDRKIKAYDKLELTDEQQIVLDALRQNCVEETLWSAIAAFQNYPFRTASGLPYQYKLKIGKDGTYNKELLIDRRENSKTLSWSSIKMAFQNCRQISGIVKRPKALGDIRGISYIYPLFWKFGLIEVPEETAKKMSGECDTAEER